jgi:hypothetical protein
MISNIKYFEISELKVRVEFVKFLEPNIQFRQSIIIKKNLQNYSSEAKKHCEQ